MSGDAYYPNVSLLLHCDGVMSGTTFTDNSPSPKTVTANGNVKIDTTQSKFGGSSAVFDGTGDYLSLTGTSFGTGDFTIEGWIRIATPSSTFCVLDTRNADYTNNGFSFYVKSTSKLAFARGNPFVATEGTTDVSADTWHHVALTRDSGMVRGYLDGTKEFEVSDTKTFSLTGWRIGHYWNASGTISAGYVDDLRITVGTARYTGDTLTVPTEAYPNHAGQITGVVKDENGDEISGATVRAYLRSTGALLSSTLSGDGSSEITGDPYWQNTVMLLYAEGTDGSTTVTDSSLAARTVSVFGNAHIEADQYKFGSASIAFDGNGDYLSVANHDALNFLLADYTIELFVRFNAVNATQTILSRYTSWATVVELYLELQSTGYIRYRAGNNIPIALTCTTSIQANTWYHVAVTCTGGTTRLFINGVQEASTTTTASLSSTGALGIGYELSGGVYYLNGYLDELRITKGVSRYTENFTPPAAAFLGATVPASPLGEYLFSLATLDEIQVIALDQAGGETFNDLLLRVTPA